VNAVVFLGGACGTGDARSEWRATTAIPQLDAAGISWYNPQLPPGQWHSGMIQVEAAAKEASVYILMVITGSTRAVASIQEATATALHHHDDPARRKKLMLVLDDIPEGTVIGGVPVVGADLADANRGRAFLRDTIASWRPDLAVYPTVEDAVNAIITDYHAGGTTGE
jgi:hypothetical protein